MIVKRNFNPLRVWSYIRVPAMFSVVWAVLAWAAFAFGGPQWQVPFTPVGVLGSALAIFIAFRNNTAYSRWWEARTLWAQITTAARVFARLVITFADSHAHAPGYDAQRSKAFQREVIYLTLAWVHALRLQLRGQTDAAVLEPLVPQRWHQALHQAPNKPLQLQFWIGQRIYEAMATGVLAGFDSFQLEGQLLALAGYQSGCERIKETPLLRQYDYFTRLFIWGFVLLLPFGMLGLFAAPEARTAAWMAIPLTTVVAWVFIIMERTGAANEDPFENKPTDVPLTTLCQALEANLCQLLGDEPPHHPPTTHPEPGILM
jgi:putative membrane protein